MADDAMELNLDDTPRCLRNIHHTVIFENCSRDDLDHINTLSLHCNPVQQCRDSLVVAHPCDPLFCLMYRRALRSVMCSRSAICAAVRFRRASQDTTCRRASGISSTWPPKAVISIRAASPPTHAARSCPAMLSSRDGTRQLMPP